MIAKPSSATWKVIALSGITLIAVGIGIGYLDDATHFKFEFISDYYNIFGAGILAGVILSFVGLIGRAKQHDRQGRLRMASVVFISPWAVLLLGYPVAGINIHDYSAIVMMLVIPASILAVVLLSMAAAKHRA